MDSPRLGYHFAKLHRLMLSFCKRDVAGLGLQISQMPFLLILLRLDAPITQDELSTALVIDKAATTRTLDQLQRSGFVDRIVNPNNRRQKLVTATVKAKAIQGDLYEILQTASNVFTQNFSQEEMGQVFKLLNRMIANAMEANS